VRWACSIRGPAKNHRFLLRPGNFTLPIARSGAEVLGVEAAPGCSRGRRTTQRANGLAEPLPVRRREPVRRGRLRALPACDKALLSIRPGRRGRAGEILRGEAALAHRLRPCDPATLARDSGVLVNVLGYRLVCAAWSTCFRIPRTSSTIALFER